MMVQIFSGIPLELKTTRDVCDSPSHIEVPAAVQGACGSPLAHGVRPLAEDSDDDFHIDIGREDYDDGEDECLFYALEFSLNNLCNIVLALRSRKKS